MEVHNIDPLFNENSKVLILGSFPSVKSRQQQFFYAHPQNRFWKVLAAVFESEVPVNVEEKKKLILDHQLALWDVIGSCDIKGSSDSSIENVVVNDLNVIMKHCKIEKICTNGGKAYDLYMRFIYPYNHIRPLKLPSTSSANAGCSFEKLLQLYQQIKV